jgi:predicted nucleic acid-binding protein
MVGRWYLDASALVKLLLEEAESAALRERWDDGTSVLTSVVARVEAERALRRTGQSLPGAIDELFDRLIVIGLTPPVIALAARLEPVALRTLEAIHLATAMDLGEDVDAFVAYDQRLADAARANGLIVEQPGIADG